MTDPKQTTDGLIQPTVKWKKVESAWKRSSSIQQKAEIGLFTIYITWIGSGFEDNEEGYRVQLEGCGGKKHIFKNLFPIEDEAKAAGIKAAQQEAQHILDMLQPYVQAEPHPTKTNGEDNSGD